MFFSGDMLVSGSVCLNPESQADFFKIIATPILDDYPPGNDHISNSQDTFQDEFPVSFPQGGICELVPWRVL